MLKVSEIKMSVDKVLALAHPINQGDYAYSFVSLKRKNFISVTPLKAALNALILALNDSAKALVALLTKKFKTSSGSVNRTVSRL